MHTDNGSGRSNGPLPVQGLTPFPASQARYHILRATNVTPAEGICINHAIHGCAVHFVESRSQPCKNDRGPCPWCREGNRLRWYGFIPVVVLSLGRVALVELTQCAVKDSTDLAGVKTLRGKGIRVTRLGAGKRGRCALTLHDWKLNGKLPPEIDTSASLDAIWGDLARQRPFEFLEEVPLA